MRYRQVSGQKLPPGSKFRRLTLWTCLASLLLQFPFAHAQQTQPVDLELVLAIDTSSSVDASEYALQRHGLAEAFRHPATLAAIRSIGKTGLAVTVVQWSSYNKHRTAVDWMAIRGAQGARRFAAALDRMPRLLKGFTGIGGAIRFSLKQIEENAFEGVRKVIDISGDGASSDGDPRPERDRAIARGVTVNGLAILTRDPDFMEMNLADYYARNVVGGEGSFVTSADGFEGFVVQIRKKLVREITGAGVANLFRPRS